MALQPPTVLKVSGTRWSSTSPPAAGPTGPDTCDWKAQNTTTPAVRANQAMGFALVGLDQTLYDGDASHETALHLAGPRDGPTRGVLL